MFDRIQYLSYLNPKLEPRPNPAKGGMGLFAIEPIAAHEMLMVWSGAILNMEQMLDLPMVYQQHSVQVEEGLYLVSFREEEPADYINHSCNPNAGLSGQITIVAMRDIEPEEEVCFDYAMSDSSDYDEFVCGCGAPNCRGRVTGRDWMLPELQTRYAGYFSPYLQRRIERLKLAEAVDY